ncbi:unnamed protein product [Medioppia subpectinata]|uniref:Major facilitator superfamily (MFS) profile domain-containing protein n=1 Tax=Medioppia subpectinata TaxID=1979941 RepID=A0A7R9QDK7_9ACAR|nr:unnamed protein product [Medioppia subpectinata]CAG2118846.1 unnamed protein product [Medioppia subpectinata]
MCSVAKSFILIIIGRVITGFASGICCGVAPTYCIQISTPKIRGLLGTGFQIFVTIGIVYVDLFGLALGWRWLCIIGLIPAVIMSIGMIFMPESPSWLMNKYGRSSQVVSALRRLRTDDSDIEGELKELQDRAEKSKAESSGFSMAAFKRPDVYKPFIIANVLMFCQQFSGINAVLFNMNSIFEASGSSMDPMVATCIVNSAMVAATISGGLIIDRLGRKILLIASGVGHVVTLGVLGYYYYADSAGMGWLPVVCLVVFVVSFSIGFGPIPWMIVAEITPGFAMGVVSACGTAFNWLCAFIVTKQFEAIQKGLNKYGAFWMFAGISAGSVLFTVLFVPETKGRSLEEMQRIFRGEKVGVDVGPHDMSGEKKEKYSINKDVTTV